MTRTRLEKPFLIVRRIILLTAATVTLLAFQICLGGQTQPALQITSPSDGTVVTPGQKISVSVSSPSNTTFKQVFVIGELPLPHSSMATSVPASFSLSIAQGTRPGKYMFTAWGTTTANQIQASPPITVDVERTDFPTTLTANKTQISFRSQGEAAPLRISGKFADGSLVDLTASSNLAYTSSNTGVATVNKNGVVIAIATGEASIAATYGQGTQSVRVSVPVTVPPAGIIHVAETAKSAATDKAAKVITTETPQGQEACTTPAQPTKDVCLP